MKKKIFPLSIILIYLVVQSSSAQIRTSSYKSPYMKWGKGPSHECNYFPIGVWLQQPKNAGKYREAGINLYVGLWKGPTEKQLSELKKAGMKVICTQNDVGLKHIDDPAIIGWMQQDEPDNAQRVFGVFPARFGSPVSPGKIKNVYKRIKSNDPSRPVLLNLGQGVAWDEWRGRGIRTNHPEDYSEYIKGADIVSFDIYPAASRIKEVYGKIWMVANGVRRLKKWSGRRKIIWNIIECARIYKEKRKAKPKHVKNEVWSSIINGSRGIIYFAHEWKPRFNDAALLSDPEMLKAVTTINRQIRDFAPVLNGPDIYNRVMRKSLNRKVPVDFMVKKYQSSLYIFAAGMQNGRTDVKFTVTGLDERKRIDVIGEGRSIKSGKGFFKDKFTPWDVHIYKINFK